MGKLRGPAGTRKTADAGLDPASETAAPAPPPAPEPADGGEAISIQVMEGGAPRLLAEGDKATGLDAGESAPGTSWDATATGWTPAEAEMFTAQLWNFGALFFGPAWLARAGEFAASAPAQAYLLDRVLPKSVGGPIGLASAMMQVGGNLTGAAVARAGLIHAVRTGRPPQAPTTRPRVLADLDETPAPPAPAPAPAEKKGSEGFHFPRDLADVVGKQPTPSHGAPAYLGLGMA